MNTLREIKMKMIREKDEETRLKILDTMQTFLISQFESLHMLRDDVCIHFDDIDEEFVLINQSKMHSLMRNWRDLLKLGRISILRENCITATINGVEYFPLVVQSPNVDVSECTLVFDKNILVDGVIYIFKNQKKRDDVFNWLEKFCQVKADEVQECLICMDNKSIYVTKCCKQPLCDCCLRKKSSLCCPFCRKEY